MSNFSIVLYFYFRAKLHMLCNIATYLLYFAGFYFFNKNEIVIYNVIF
jgi:hypothetical protein